MAQAPKSFQQVLQELWELLKAYAQQETVGPLKNLARQVGLGLAGTLSFTLGYFLVVLGVMRLLQTHWGWAMEHNWFAYFVGAVMLGAMCAWAFFKAKGRGQEPHSLSKGAKPGADPTSAPVDAVTAKEARP